MQKKHSICESLGISVFIVVNLFVWPFNLWLKIASNSLCVAIMLIDKYTQTRAQSHHITVTESFWKIKFN